MFDRILLMAEGRTAFMGNASDALSFFSSRGFSCPTNYNPADFFISTLAIVPGQEAVANSRHQLICDAYERSQFRHQIDNAIKQEHYSNGKYDSWNTKKNQMNSDNHHNIGWISQFRVVLWRSWLNVVRDPELLAAKVVFTIVSNEKY